VLATLLDCQSRVSSVVDSVNATDNLGRTALHLFILYGHNLQSFQSLIDAGADVNVQDVDGNTPLHLALQQRYYECASILVEHKDILVGVTNIKNIVPLEMLSDDENSRSKLPTKRGWGVFLRVLIFSRI
jgi:ankyrin repeat protein